MKKLILLAKSNLVFTAMVAVAIVAGGGYFLLHRNVNTGQLLTVQPGEFVQQIDVSGKVIAAQNVDLGFTQTGRVARVNVSVGDYAPRGTLLASLENGDLSAAVSQKQAALENQKAKLAQLEAGTRPESIAVSDSSVKAAQITLDRASQTLLDAINDAYTKSDDAIHNKVDQFITNPRVDPKLNFQVNNAQLNITIESNRSAIEQLLQAWQGDVAILTSSSDLSAAVTRAQGHLSACIGFLSDINAALNGAIPTAVTPQSTINTYITDIATSRASLNTVSSALTSAITAQKNAAAALETAQKNLALAKAPPTQADIDAQTASIRAAAADVESAQAQLQKTLVVAPFSGTVSRVDIKTGEIASANASPISMISAGTFQIESYIPEINIALVHVGDPAVATLDAYGDGIPFSAKVISIDPAETVRDGVPMYRGVLEFSAKDDRIKSGMTANVHVTTMEKKNVISIPQGAVIQRGGKKFVTVKVGETAQEREVTTGDVSSLGNIEIRSGLEGGDVVVLTK